MQIMHTIHKFLLQSCKQNKNWETGGWQFWKQYGQLAYFISDTVQNTKPIFVYGTLSNNIVQKQVQSKHRICSHKAHKFGR